MLYMLPQSGAHFRVVWHPLNIYEFGTKCRSLNVLLSVRFLIQSRWSLCASNIHVEKRYTIGRKFLIDITKPGKCFSLTGLAFARFSMKTKEKFLFSMYTSLILAYNHQKSCVSCNMYSTIFRILYNRPLEIAFQGL
jgi:hypothetical protein